MILTTGNKNSVGLSTIDKGKSAMGDKLSPIPKHILSTIDKKLESKKLRVSNVDTQRMTLSTIDKVKSGGLSTIDKTAKFTRAGLSKVDKGAGIKVKGHTC